jgi:hypothetical protein
MRLNYFGLGLVGILSLGVVTSAQAETCRALNVLGGTGTQVKKTVSPLGTLVTSDNWNTDFAVAGGKTYSRYVATIVPENNANYDLKLNLKYSNNTSDQLYNKGNVEVKVKQPIRLSGQPRSQSEPYQVNVFVGGISAIGNTYTVSVAGCN